MTDAEVRVDRLFAHLSRIDVPVWSGVIRSSDPEALEDARDLALDEADAAGLGDLLDLAHERVALAYRRHLGGLGYWTGVFAIHVPLDPRDRALSQAIVDDLVTALVVEDVAPAHLVQTLRRDGEQLLTGDAGKDADTATDDGAPPIDPSRGPLVAATPVRGIALLVLAGLAYLDAVAAALLAVIFFLPGMPPRRRDLVLAVLLGALALVLVGRVTGNLSLGILAGVATTAVVPLSSFGLDRWMRRDG